MSKVMRCAGFVWALPLTVLGIIYTSLFTLLGWYVRTGTFGDALVWNSVADKIPELVSRHLLKWGCHSVGNVVVLASDIKSQRGQIMLKHEQEIVRQTMVLGIFHPVLYSLVTLGLVIACPKSNPHFSNIFEVEARRAANQVVDVEGTMKRLQELAQNKRKS